MTENSKTPPTILPKRRGLGRGLDALFEDTEVRAAAPNFEAQRTLTTPSAFSSDASSGQGASTADGSGTPGTGGRLMLNVALLRPGTYQPRRHFDDDALHQLAQSIAQHGIIQPLLVRPIKGEAGQYEIIAGERRWRAAQKAQLHDVPVIINPDITDREALQLGLIENLQREDLNPIEEAAGYQRLLDEFDFIPERLGEMLGKSRSHIVNTIRLLQLPNTVRDLLVQGKLTAGHARALIGLPTAETVAEQIIAKGLSVRQTEKLAAAEHAAFGQDKPKGRKKSKAETPDPRDPHVIAIENGLIEDTGLNVRVDLTGETEGTITIEFKNFDQLDDMIKRLSRTPTSLDF